MDLALGYCWGRGEFCGWRSRQWLSWYSFISLDHYRWPAVLNKLTEHICPAGWAQSTVKYLTLAHLSLASHFFPCLMKVSLALISFTPRFYFFYSQCFKPSIYQVKNRTMAKTAQKRQKQNHNKTSYECPSDPESHW